MGTVNGTITGVTLSSGNPAGSTNTVSSVVYTRKVYLCTVDFPVYTGSTDTMTVTGLLTAINAATRDGKTRTLRWAATAYAGIDAAGQGVLVGGASVQALTLSNTTTTGDGAGNMTDSANTEITSTTGTTIGVGVMVGVDES